MLLTKGANVNDKGSHGMTPLIGAAENGHLDVVKLLVDAGARLHDAVVGNTALDWSIANDHQDVVDYLANCGAPGKIVKSESSQIAFSNRPISLETNSPMSSTWISATKGSLTFQSVAEFLNSPNVNSLRTLIIAHNILLLAVRQGAIKLHELKLFQGDSHYLATNIYAPMRKFMHNLDEYERVLCKYVLRHARKIGFIENYHVFSIELNAEMFGEIQQYRQELSMVIEKISRQLQDLDNRVQALEQWSSRATEEFRKVCENTEHMMQEIAMLGNSLNNLHDVLKENERRKFYAGIAGVVLSFVPVLGGALSASASASAEILLGMNQEDLLELGTDAAKGTINHFMSTDLSSFQSVEIITSERFMNSLDAPTKARIETVVKCSKFGSIDNLRFEFFEAHNVIKEFEKESEIDEGVDSELATRFGIISMDSNDSTAIVGDAALELFLFCRRRIPNFEASETEVKEELFNHCNEDARLNFEVFQTIFKSYEQKYRFSKSQDNATNELDKRFSKAAQKRSSIDLASAMFVLRNLFAASIDSEANKMSFSAEVKKLFEQHRNANGRISRQGFIRVGLQVLFKNNKNRRI